MKVWILITFFASGPNGTAINHVEFFSKAECQRAAITMTGPVKSGKKVIGYAKSFCKMTTKPEGHDEEVENIYTL